MADGRAEAGVVVVGDAADPFFDFGRILLAEFFDREVFDVAAAFAGEAGDRIGVAHRFQGLAHQNQALLFDVDDLLPRSRVWLIRMARDRARRGRRHVEQERHGDVAFAADAADVEAGGRAGPGLFFSPNGAYRLSGRRSA